MFNQSWCRALLSLLCLGMIGVAFGCADRKSSPLEPASNPSAEMTVPPSAITGTVAQPGTPVAAPMDLGPTPQGPTVEAPRPPLSVTSRARFDPAGERRVSTVTSVTIHAEVIGAVAGSKLIIEFFTPSEMPFERRELTLTGSAFETQQAEFALPIAGTMIDTSYMTGEWKAKLFVDGVALTEQTFDLSI